VVALRRGLDQEIAHGEQEPWTPAEHPTVGCLTGWGSARDAASFLLPSLPWTVSVHGADARPCGVDAADPGPFILPVAWSAGEVPVRFGSWPARHLPQEAGAAALTDGHYKPRDRSVMGPGRSPGPPARAAVNPDVRPLAITRQKRLAGLDRGREGMADQGQLALPFDPESNAR
jgi:hypothetical protein